MALAPGLLRLNGPCGVVWETPVQWVVTPNYTPNYTPELHPRELILSFCELMVYSGQSRGRTGDLRIFSPSLYQLSYLSKSLQIQDLWPSSVCRLLYILAPNPLFCNHFSDIL
jgi:hypothetical protein